jgi:hypothetical protein
MRSHATQPFRWLKNRSKQQTINFETTNIEHSVNTNTRLDAISKIWKSIYGKHKNGEPSMHHFFQQYGEQMKRDLCELPAITGKQLAKTLHKHVPHQPGWILLRLMTFS